MVERREDPAASTAMFRAYLQRGDDENGSKSINPMVWVAVTVVLLVVIVVGVMLIV